MFHILAENTTPNDVLIAGYWNKEAGEFTNAPNQVLCGAGVGERRNAISYKKFKELCNSQKLRIRNMCAACGKREGIHKPKKDET